MVHTVRQFHSDERGLAALEFAILAPLLAIAVIGVSDYALRFNAQASLDDALRLAVEGAIRIGDDAAGVAQFLQHSGYNAAETLMSSASTSPASSSGGEAKMTMSVQKTDVCFVDGTMSVSQRGSGTCAAPEKWLRLSGAYPLQTLTSGLITLNGQIDVKVQ